MDVFDTGRDYDWARDEEAMPVEEWTERDERIWNEHCEMQAERDRDIEAFSRLIPQQIVVDAETFDWLQRLIEED